MPTFTNIDGEESSTITFTVGAISLSRNSSAELQEILCLGDPEVASSLGVARVTASAPASTNAALNVRIVGGPSTVTDFSVRAVLPSTYGDHGLRVLQSTAADLQATVGQASTVWAVQQGGYVAPSTTVNVSSLAGPVIVRSSAADQLVTVYQSSYANLLANVHNSTIGDLLASVQQNSTAWVTQARLHTSSQGALEGSTATPGVGVLGLHVRQVNSAQLSTTVEVQSSNSTVLLSLLSSQTNPQKVHAFFIGASTSGSPCTAVFMSGTTNHVWGCLMSSGYFGAHVAVSPPAELFRAAGSEPLNLVLQSVSTRIIARVSLSWRNDA